MIALPKSLSGRLLAGAALFIGIALIIAALAISLILEHFIHRQIDQRLDGQIDSVVTALRLDGQGHMSAQGLGNGPPFDRPLSGWYWQAIANAETLGSASLVGGQIHLQPDQPPPPPRHEANDAYAAAVTGPNGEPLVARMRPLSLAGKNIIVIATAPPEAIDHPLRDALTPLAISLGLLGLALLFALIFQVRFGLRPLRRLETALAEVSSGKRNRLPEEQPAEIAGLVHQMNAVLNQNERGLERARRHVANLAHGLKTPLATLAVTAQSTDATDQSQLSRLVDVMDRLIRHHLARARAAALGGPVRARTKLSDRLADIGSAMTVIHRERRVAYDLDIPADFIVACESQDLDELFGNLLDNAFRFATKQVTVRASKARGMITTTIEDDGIGLAEGQVLTALQPGFRFDETTSGYGFGLPIALEITQLYGGDLTISRSELGGLLVKVDLPIA